MAVLRRATAKHAPFVAQLAAAALVPVAYGRLLSFYEIQYVALVLVHHLLASVRDMAGSPTIQADVQYAIEEAAALGAGCGVDEDGEDVDMKRHHYAQSVRYLLMYALVLTLFTAVEAAVGLLSLVPLARVAAALWVVRAAHDAAQMWRVLVDYAAVRYPSYVAVVQSLAQRVLCDCVAARYGAVAGAVGRTLFRTLYRAWRG
jgi:hypothetical protein